MMDALGYDVGTRRDVAGGYWPYPLQNFYIFGAGLWVGALRPRANEAGRLDTLVTSVIILIRGNRDGAMPPSSSKAGNQIDRIYKYPETWDSTARDFKSYL